LAASSAGPAHFAALPGIFQLRLRRRVANNAPLATNFRPDIDKETSFKCSIEGQEAFNIKRLTVSG
jgi:hypothetical protein